MHKFILILSLFSLLTFHSVSAQNTVSTGDSTVIDSAAVPVIPPSTKNQRLFSLPRREIVSSEFAGVIAEDVTDYLQMMPGVTSLDYGSVGQESPLMLHGLKPQISQVALDGMLLTNPLTGFLDTANLPINLVNKVRLTGDAATVPAIIDVQLLQHDKQRPYSRVQFRTGDWGYSDLGISFELPIKKSSNFLFSGSRQEFDGYFFINPDTVINEPRKLVHSRFVARLLSKPTSHFELNIISMLNKNKSRAPGPLFPDLEPLVKNGRRQTNRFDTRISARLGNPGNGDTIWRAHTFFSQISRQTFGSFSPFNNSAVDSLLFATTSRVYGAKVEFHLLRPGNELEIGAGLRRMELASKQLSHRSDHLADIYLRDVLQLRKRLQITAALAGELFAADSDKFDGETTSTTLRLHPSIEMRYKIGKAAEAWLLASRTSRYPAFAERYWPGKLFLGQANLQPERITGAELGIRIKKKTTHFVSTFFTNRVSDWIGKKPRADTLAFGPGNFGNRTVSGIDFKFVWDYFSDGQLGVIANFLHVSEAENFKQLFVPEYSVYGFFEYGRPFFEQYIFVRLRLSGRIYGERHGWVYPIGGGLPTLAKLSPAIVPDVRASLIFSDVILTFSLENILDQQYQLAVGLFMPPKTFRFSIDWQFWD